MRDSDWILKDFGWVSLPSVRSLPWTNMAPICWAIVFASMMALGLAGSDSTDPVERALERSKLLDYAVLYEEALVHLDMENTENITNQPLKLKDKFIEVSSTDGEDMCNNTVLQTEGIPWVAGNSSMHFNSSYSYVRVKGTAESVLRDGMSVSLWVKNPEVAQTCQVMKIHVTSELETQSNETSLRLRREWNLNNNITYKLHDDSDDNQPILKATFNKSWEWNMISFSIDTMNITMFENGAHGDTARYNFQSYDHPSIILTLNGNIEGCSDLEVDEVALWNRPLNMTEMIALRIQPFNASCPLHVPVLADYRDSVRGADILEASSSLQDVGVRQDFTAADVYELQDIIKDANTRKLLMHKDLSEPVKLRNREAFLQLHGTIFSLAEMDNDIESSIEPITMVQELEEALREVYFDDDFAAESENISTPFVETIFRTLDGSDKDHTLGIDAQLSVTIPSGTFDSAESRKIFVMVFDEQISPALGGKSDGMIATHTISIEVSEPKVEFTVPISITFTLNDTENKLVSNNSYAADCSYLDVASSTWKTDGVETETDNSTGIVTCKTNHLTNFAVLMSPYELEDNDTLSALSYILLTISMICLLVTFLVLTCLREIGNSQRIQILKHFIVALFTAQALFVFTTELMTFSKPLCKLSVVLSHYFWVATFAWMLVQGVQLYTKVRRLVGAHMKQLFYVIFAWGFPLPIAVLPVLLFGSYYNDQVTGPGAVCWIPKELVWFLVVPLMLIFIVNFGVTVLVMRTFLTVKVNKDKTNTEKLKSSMRAVIVMVPVLGLTWAFGFILIVDQNGSEFFQYIFVILNCLQGVFVFLFHLVMNEDVRSAVLRRRNKVASSAENTIFTKVPRNKIGEQTAGTDTTKAPIPSDSSSNL